MNAMVRHPCLYFGAADLESFRARVKSGGADAERYAAFVAAADELLAEALLTEEYAVAAQNAARQLLRDRRPAQPLRVGAGY